MYCDACGEDMKRSDRVCPNCGSVRRLHLPKWATWVAVFMLLSSMVYWTRYDFLAGLRPDPRREIARQKIFQSAEFEVYVKQHPNDRSAMKSLSERGLARLSDSQVERYVELHTVMLEKASTRVCAEVNRSSAEALETALKGMGTKEYKEYIRLIATAVEAELRPKDPPHTYNAADSQQAILELAKSYTDGERARLGTVVENIWIASDEDACWAARSLYRGALSLQNPQQRIALLRTLVTKPE